MVKRSAPQGSEKPKSSSFHPCPRVLIAGTGSGVGKTSVTLGIIRALRRRGIKICPCKVGPDFLDPTYLALAAGQTCYNLDTFMCGAEYVSKMVSALALDYQLLVIEGAMGLFDGASTVSIEGSAAEVARLLQAPVVLVCNAHGQGRSLAATVSGFCGFEPDVKVKGVIANRCGSASHLRILRDSLGAASLPKLLGGIPRGAFPSLQSRHLGLVSADALQDTEQTISTLADALESTLDVEQIVDLAREAPPLSIEGESRKRTAQQHTVRIGIALDDAFHFYYPDNLDALTSLGAEIIRFSPLRDRSLPDALDALYIGGGYPEVYASKLSQNRGMLDSILRFCRSGYPIYAECGGLMYLSQAIIALDNTTHPMVGLFPGTCRMLDRFKTLGYTEVEFTRDTIWGPSGTRLRGHEFHYSELVESSLPPPDWEFAYRVSFTRDPLPVSEGYQRGNILTSYVHLHLASHPSCVQHFIDLCARQRSSQKGRILHAKR